MSQIMNLLNLTPCFQEDVLFLVPAIERREAVTERQLWRIVAEVTRLTRDACCDWFLTIVFFVFRRGTLKKDARTPKSIWIASPARKTRLPEGCADVCVRMPFDLNDELSDRV